MKLVFLRSLHSGEGSRPSTVPFHKAGVTVEEQQTELSPDRHKGGSSTSSKDVNILSYRQQRVFEKFQVGTDDNSGTGRHED